MAGVQVLLLLRPPVFREQVRVELHAQSGPVGNAQASVLVAHLAALDDVADPLVVVGVQAVERHGHGAVSVYDVVSDGVGKGEGGDVEAYGGPGTQLVGAVHAEFHAHVPGGVVVPLEGQRSRVGVRRGHVGGHVAAHDVQVERLVQGLVAVTARNVGAVGTRRRVPLERRQPDMGGNGDAAHEPEALPGAEDILEPSPDRFFDPLDPAVVDPLHEP